MAISFFKLFISNAIDDKQISKMIPNTRIIKTTAVSNSLINDPFLSVIFTAKAKVNLSANFSETIFTVADAIKPRAVDVWCAYSALAQNVNNGYLVGNAYVASYNSTFYGRSNGTFTAEASGIVGSIWWEI